MSGQWRQPLEPFRFMGKPAMLHLAMDCNPAFGQCNSSSLRCGPTPPRLFDDIELGRATRSPAPAPSSTPRPQHRRSQPAPTTLKSQARSMLLCPASLSSGCSHTNKRQHNPPLRPDEKVLHVHKVDRRN